MIVRRQRFVATASIDPRWASTASAANLTDGNNATEIQVNNESAVQHWVQFDFNMPVKLSSFSIRARGGGAGCGAMVWITSNGQIVTSSAQNPSTDFTVTFDGSTVTWVRGIFTSTRTSFDGFGEITPNYAAAPTVRGIMRRQRGATSVRGGNDRANPIDRPSDVVITTSIDTSWTIGNLANLTDNNTGTEIQANNTSVVGHWVDFAFSKPYRLALLRLLSRGGGAGSGNCTWVTSDSQSQSNGSMPPSTEAQLDYTRAPVTSVRGTWTVARTNFDGWAEIWMPGVVDAGTNYLGGYTR